MSKHCPTEESTEHSSTDEQKERASADDEDGHLQSVDNSPRNTKNLSREAEQLTRASQQIIEKLPEKRVLIKRHPNCMISLSNTMNKSDVSELLSKQENQLWFWVSSRAFAHVCISEVSLKANVLGLHVIYKRKSNGRTEARTMPLGHRDPDRDDVGGDNPSLSLDAMYLLLCFVVEKAWND